MLAAGPLVAADARIPFQEPLRSDQKIKHGMVGFDLS
jgi:hypothetical protein